MSGETGNSDGVSRLERLHEALDAGDLDAVRTLIHEASPGEVADLLESLPLPQRNVVWQHIDAAAIGDVLVELNEEVAAGLIRAMEPGEIATAAAGLEIDDLADLLPDLPEAARTAVVGALDRDDREALRSIMRYAEDSAGGLMNPDTLTVPGHTTVEQMLDGFRRQAALPVDTDAIFVVDEAGTYLGVLPLTVLLTAHPETTAAAIMNAEAPRLTADTTAHEVAMVFEHHDLISAAVVDEQMHLIGKITIDDVVDVIREEADHSMMSMAGLDEDEDMFAPVAESARRRSVWLGVNLATAFLAAWAANLFEATLAQVVMLAVLLPVVPSMGGVAGSQTLILMTRGIALGQISRSNARTLLVKELGVAMLNGIGWAIVVAVVTSWWFETWRVGVVIAGALAANLVCAAVAGFFVPLMLRRLSVDPALAGGVVLTTITDVVGIIAFLGLGTLLLL